MCRELPVSPHTCMHTCFLQQSAGILREMWLVLLSEMSNPIKNYAPASDNKSQMCLNQLLFCISTAIQNRFRSLCVVAGFPSLHHGSTASTAGQSYMCFSAVRIVWMSPRNLEEIIRARECGPGWPSSTWGAGIDKHGQQSRRPFQRIPSL